MEHRHLIRSRTSPPFNRSVDVLALPRSDTMQYNDATGICSILALLKRDLVMTPVDQHQF